MQELPGSLFDIYALSLPRGHGFGNRPPIGAWRSDDDSAFGVVTEDEEAGSVGILVARRRVDHVWVVTVEEQSFASVEDARSRLALLLRASQTPEPMPRNTTPRPALHDLGDQIGRAHV